MFYKANFGFYIVLCLTIVYVPYVCNAECDEYIVVYEEHFKPTLEYTPKKQGDINWDEVLYPDNSTTIPKKKKCFVEFSYVDSKLSCKNSIPKPNFQSHTIIPNNHSAKLIANRKNALDEPKINATKQEKPHEEIIKELELSMYEINLIYINENKKHDISCDYAETVCADAENHEHYSISDEKSPSVKPAEILEISIDRDETSPVQPIFTGYFPESSYNPSKHNVISTDSKTGTINLVCHIFKDKICKKCIENKYSKLINLYINTNITPNNTRTKYPNCTNDTRTSDNTLNVKCEDVQFAKYNQHIILTLPPKKELMNWNCEITKLNISMPNKEKNIKLLLKKCLNATNSGKNNYDDDIVTPASGSKKIENATELIKANLTQITSDNIITILITEKESNCSHNSPLNIHEGKIIDLDLNNNASKILQTSNVELILSNCINGNIPIVKESQPHSKAELNIILKNESLNTSNFKQFNGTLKGESDKHIILLRCDHPNGDSNNKTTNNKTILQCESIDLHLYNITGIEVNANGSQTSNKNETKELNKSDVNIGDGVNNTTRVHEEVSKKSDSSTNKTVEPTNKSTENNTKLVETIAVPKTISESKENLKSLNINRRKDIPEEMTGKSLGLESSGTEKIMLITILAIVGASIFIMIALRMWPQKREYTPAPTREPPPDDEETPV